MTRSRLARLQRVLPAGGQPWKGGLPEGQLTLAFETDGLTGRPTSYPIF